MHLRSAKEKKRLMTPSASEESNIHLADAKKIKAQSDYFPPDTVTYYRLSQEAMAEFSADKPFDYMHSNWDLDYLFIAPVAMIGHAKQKTWGVFTTQSIASGAVLGEYLGEKKTYAIEEEALNLDYFFKLSEPTSKTNMVKGVDARLQRNWTAMVNGTVLASANVVAIRKNTRIFYVADQAIEPGMQLLLNYGESYRYDGQDNEGQRYLKPENNWSESYDYLRQFDYDQIPYDLPASLQNHLKLPEGTWTYLLPTTADLPIIFFHEDSIVLQHDAENLTRLMLACWQGDITEINALLVSNTNLNYQSNIVGETALHFILLTPNLRPKVKQGLLARFLEQGALLSISNRLNACPLMAFIGDEALQPGDKEVF
mgnify:CR=1 FL=1